MASPTLLLNCEFLPDHSGKLACIQESKLSAHSKDPVFPGYALIRKNRPASGGRGLVMLVHHPVPYVPINTSTLTNQDLSLALLGIRIQLAGSDLDIYNLSVLLVIVLTLPPS
jgi:hypothetical protein